MACRAHRRPADKDRRRAERRARCAGARRRRTERPPTLSRGPHRRSRPRRLHGRSFRSVDTLRRARRAPGALCARYVRARDRRRYRRGRVRRRRHAVCRAHRLDVALLRSRRLHILAGGLRDWKAAGLPLTTDLPVPRTASFGPRPRPALRAARDEVLAVAEGRSDAQLLETQRDKTYAFRDRDIRGAKRLSASALFEDANGGRPAPPGEIDRMVRDLGLDRTKRTVVSCGSGVGASAAYLALTERGFKDV